ncbi:indolepyruvate ferredoxin oxidoreductase family protein [Acuticoccus sp. MNP-M23]|uniref:indolepyruvate ferredoxin oxidoreductase family protein n=1 Tax=Acuticoccus sp. MNP-M23 TaxID=3072793 RepID=UPI002814CA17|nr:indolepyruvate ferredoxin oxidoreductase family protein [Acuticoccus sp. MNP-M23]WMS41762.1 indolepyruvate ferredoxin oxidoreductase family protein [Acuticoccus sp. MNP-M23]
MTRPITLDDRYENDREKVYLTGIQTIIRIAIDRRRLDIAAGLKTGAFVSGYRGSPLGGVDQEFVRNASRLDPLGIRFQPGVNEELGATAVWGTQKVGLHGKGSDYDGVFGLWYGKAPGVDRAGDVLKQANASGTARHGGVLALCGDDLLAKSSVIAAQSEFALQHFEIPFFNPADLQDFLDYGLHGLALSRFAGNWTGLICVADTMDASGLVNVDLQRLSLTLPEGADPRRENDLNRPLLLATRLETEHLLREIRLPAVGAYVRANGLDRVVFGTERARIGFVATGKAYRDLRQAFDLLGIDEVRARALGIAVYKVAMPWPLETQNLRAFARGKERLLVVEHKRAFMEPQIRDALYSLPDGQRPAVYGKRTPAGEPCLSDVLELKPQDLVHAILRVVPGLEDDPAMAAVSRNLMERAAWAAGHAEGGQRTAYFCAGCPHSASTRTPEGARALPGIGCHAMTEINGNTTDGQIAMGGEGATWVGQAPFSRDTHVFVNMGDGTYYHSGILAIRQAVAADVSITYRILFNDAVAMTGGQAHDGPLDVGDIVRQVAAEGVPRIAVLSEEPDRFGHGDIPRGVPVHHRDALKAVQAEFATESGVSVIVFDQTCAAEKRRRRKKGEAPDPPRRVFINERICEDCGDCSVQSNCIAVEPLDTQFGTKRTINQSSCNKDTSCVKGFCPSFALIEGADPRRAAGARVDIDALAAALPAPQVPTLTAMYNVLITGIGGFGVTTVGAVLAMAGHIDGITASTLDMTGLAQKNGPVTSHVRFAPAGMDIEGPRVPIGTLDTLIASDMLVACNADSLSMTAPGRTLTVVNTKVQPTAEFVMKRVLSFDETRMTRTLREASRHTEAVDAAHLAAQLFGDQIFMNMLLVGAAFQHGGLPLSEDAILQAIRLNGAAVTTNIAAFRAGRILAADPQAILQAAGERPGVAPMDLDARIAFLADELVAYQNAAYADRFRKALAPLIAADKAAGQGERRLTRTAADALYKAMAYKDEYEVARLYGDPAYWARLKAEFETPSRIRILLAPPGLFGVDAATGRPAKRTFGPWIFPVLRVLARLKGLRGTPFDPFGKSAERRAERALIDLVCGDVALVARSVGTAPYGLLCELVKVAAAIKGFGPVKDENRAAAMKRRDALLAQLDRARHPAPDGAEQAALIAAE